MKLVHQTFQQQIPEFIREEYPQFVEFIRQYYRFLETTNTLYDVGDTLDIDTASDPMLDQFYNTYAKGLPVPSAFNKREFLRHCKEFYSSKGTPESFNFLFKAFFNKEAAIKLPSDNILKVSDGRWLQYSSIDVSSSYLISGISMLDVLYEGRTIDLSNSNGTYLVEIHKVEYLGAEKYRIYFRKQTRMTLILNQVINVSTAGVLQASLILIPSIYSIEILFPGVNFQIGSLITIPGVAENPIYNRNTIARVTSVNSTGGITGIQIIEYGYEYGFTYPDGSTVLVSPYANKPASGSYSIGTSIATSGAVTYSLNINDTIDNINESFNAIYTQQTGSTYVTSGYWAPDGYAAYYTSTNVLNISSPFQTGVIDTSLTYEQWLASRATLKLHKALISDQIGSYVGNRSLISDPAASIQDNYYYQLYSYVIQSEVDETLYKQALPLIHPAGLKRFGEITKIGDFDMSSELSVDFILSLLINDGINITESFTPNKY